MLMQKTLLTTLLAASAMTLSAAAPSLPNLATRQLNGRHAATLMAPNGTDRISFDLKGKRGMDEAGNARRKAAPAKSVRRAPGAPAADMPIISETPEGDMVQYVRTGVSLAYSMFYGILVQPSDGTLNDIVTNGDKVYMNNLFSLGEMETWVEGDAKDGKYSFTFPQHIEHDEENWGTEDEPEIEIADFYALVLEYDENEDWYVVADDQTYTMTVSADGTLTPDNPDLMIGVCMWYGEDELGPGEEPYWAWVILGDTYTDLKVFDLSVPAVPEEAEFEDWTFVNGPFASTVEVAFLDDKCYLRGFATDYPTIEKSAIAGTVKDGKVTFESGQYLGVIDEYRTTAYMLAGETSVLEDEYGAYTVFDMTDSLVFDYSETDKLMTTAGAFCISTCPDKVLYYSMYNDIAIKQPVPNAEISELRQPVFEGYSEAMPEYEIPENIMFYLPQTDVDYNILDTEKYFWNLLVDDDVYLFAADEYPGLAEMYGDDFEMTDVPYSFNDGFGFYGWYGLEDFYIYVEGYDTLAVRGVYKDGDKVLYSPLLYIVGDPSAVKAVETSEILSTSYFDLQGRAIGKPVSGICIRADKMADGSVRHSKVVVR